MRSVAEQVDSSDDALELIDLFINEGTDIALRSAELEKHDAFSIISAGIHAFGKDAAVSTAFGAGGLCVMHMAQQIDPEVRAFYIDTGFAFPETETLLQAWVTKQKLNLLRVLPLLTAEEQAREQGEALWARDPDLCCALRKLEPNQRALGGIRLWIAALRRDESATRKATPVLSRTTLRSGHTLLKLCPIVSWSKKEVWSYIEKHELPYNELHDRNYPSIGCTHCTRPVMPGGDERAGRWAGFSKKECGLHLDKHAADLSLARAENATQDLHALKGSN